MVEISPTNIRASRLSMLNRNVDVDKRLARKLVWLREMWCSRRRTVVIFLGLLCFILSTSFLFTYNGSSITSRYGISSRFVGITGPDTNVSCDAVETVGSVPISLHPSIDKRGAFQKCQVEKYCRKYHSPDTIPQDESHIKEALKHLLVDRERGILFCIAPKLASTHIRVMFAALNGVISTDAVFEKYTHDRNLYTSNYNMLKMSEEERKKKLNTYFKFVMTRNPLERIVSAYRNKLENHPINAKVSGVFDEAKIEMIKTHRPRVYSRWEESGRTIKVFPTFNEFIRYLDSHSYYELDHHFRPLQYICHPCVFHYDFYANLKLMPEEFDQLFKKFNIPNNSFKNEAAHHDTESMMPEYYAKLSKTEKKMVHKFVHQELEFYYHIYPEERDMHIPLIGQFE